jgi:hypothetical protein
LTKATCPDITIQYGQPLQENYLIKTYFNDKTLKYTLGHQTSGTSIPIWLKFEQATTSLTLSGTSNDPADIKPWELQIRGSDGYSAADVLQKFKLIVKNNKPTVKKAQADIDWKLSKTQTIIPLKFEDVFQDADGGTDVLLFEVLIQDDTTKAYGKLTAKPANYWLKYDTITKSLKGKPTLSDLKKNPATGNLESVIKMRLTATDRALK